MTLTVENVAEVKSHGFGAQTISPKIRESGSIASSVEGLRNLRMMHLLQRVALRFNQAGIPLMALKGAALNLTVYERPQERPMEDIDLLIRLEDVASARKLLESLGALRGGPEVREDFFPTFHYETEYRLGSIQPVKIDLHIRPFRPMRYAQTVSLQAFWETAGPHRLGSATLLLPSRETMLIHLAVHAAVHDFAQPKWLTDIFHWVLHHRHSLDWDVIVRRVESWQLVLPFRRALERVEQEFGDVLPRDVRSCLDAKRVSWRDHLALHQAPRDADHPVAHVLTNVVCTPSLWLVLRYLGAIALPDRSYMVDWYRRRHVGWLAAAHCIRWLSPVAAFTRSCGRLGRK